MTEQLGNFWGGFFKIAAIKFSPSLLRAATRAHAPAPLLGTVKKLPFAAPTERTLNYKDIFSKARADKMKPPTVTDYGKADAQWQAKKPPPSTLTYGKGGQVAYTAPGKTVEQSKAVAQQKVQAQTQGRLANAVKGGYTDPQMVRAGKNTPPGKTPPGKTP